MTMRDININSCFIDDIDGFWDIFWSNNIGVISKKIDPDSRSATLRIYHQILWSRELPNGQKMVLEKGTMSDYLKWNGMRFASDSIFTQHRYKKCLHILQLLEKQIPDYRKFVSDTLRLSYTIGGMIIFPKMKGSMNQDRGTNPMIADRWDMTLECVKRYYENPQNCEYCYNPLWTTIKRNEEFFSLFVDFSGYINFFFLQDYLNSEMEVIRFFDDCMDKDGNFSKKYPLPQNTEEYLRNIAIQKEIVNKRNKRIRSFIQS